ncbi:substrate-binding domain-containing protein [Actinospica robiniae]|uniref:substrate-binding domain-containing protein n=1 Tax=Actinospica robiniae TaxID=304901 RepID=UPI0012F7CAF9|nr:substrate-binding domain-containing protein [Actinospica robiniae]
MFSPDRRELLLAHLREHGTSRISDLVSVLGASDVTVRRDVDNLEREGLARRFHGGVALIDPDAERRADRQRELKIGVVLPAGPYFRSVLAGAREAADDAGAHLMLALSHYDGDEDLRSIRRHLDNGAHGLLLAPAPEGSSRHTQLEKELRKLRVPVVLVERQLAGERLVDVFDHVVTDHDAGARGAVEHLARLGHRRIALLVKDLGPTAPLLRAGYARAVTALNLATDMPVLVVPHAPGPDGELDRALAQAADTLAAHRVTAVLAHGDEEALALQNLLLHRGVRIPGQLAMVSYDDEIASVASIPMSAIAPPKQALGQIGLERLIDRIRNGPATPVHHLTLLPTLVVRETCGGAARIPRAARAA